MLKVDTFCWKESRSGKCRFRRSSSLLFACFSRQTCGGHEVFSLRWLHLLPTRKFYRPLLSILFVSLIPWV